MGEFLSGIGKVLIAALPFFRRGKAEREAGIDPVSAQDGRADDLLNGALGRLGALAPDDSILKKTISGIAAVAVRPEHFSKPYVREWLSLADTKKSLKVLAKAKLVSAPESKDIYEELIQSYIQMSGEQRILAEDCVMISVAFLKASVQAAANDVGVVAITQSGFESVHDRFNDVSRQLEGVSEGINNEGKLRRGDSQIAESLHGQTEAIRSLVNVSGEQSKALAGVEKAISNGEQFGFLARGLSGADSKIIDSEAMRRLEIISKSRFFIGFDLTENTQRLLTSIEKGDLARVSNSVKSEIYSWCARFLSATNCELAQSLLEKAASLGSGEVLDVARAFVTAKNGNVPSALESLSLLETPLSRSAAFIITKMAGRHLNGLGGQGSL